MMALGELPVPCCPGQGGETVVYLQVEGAARDHDLDPEGACVPESLGHCLQAGRVTARPGAERVDLV